MDILQSDNINAVVTDVDKGVISLRGTTISASIKEECGLAVSNMKGAREIKNEIAIVKGV
jgi:hypothetical protein